MTKPTGRPNGRPSLYSPELAAEICTRLSRGEALRKMCLDDHMPDESTVYDWLFSSKTGDFPKLYALARERQTEFWAEECIQIADETERDTITKTGRNGEEYESQNSEWINRSRLRVDTRKWLMSKLAPKKYGEKIQQEITGKDGESLIPSITINTVKPKE
jgi:hypothetical protein